jgi:hypothetical protein
MMPLVALHDLALHYVCHSSQGLWLEVSFIWCWWFGESSNAYLAHQIVNDGWTDKFLRGIDLTVRTLWFISCEVGNTGWCMRWLELLFPNRTNGGRWTKMVCKFNCNVGVNILELEETCLTLVLVCSYKVELRFNANGEWRIKPSLHNMFILGFRHLWACLQVA